MRIGIIDLGTNSIRFSIYEINYNLEKKIIYKDKLMVRLGRGLFVNRYLDAVSVRRTLAALSQYKRMAAHYGVRELRAYGTCALREANDSQKFVRMVKHFTGIKLNVISGRIEGRLIACGILANQRRLTGRFALVDIGGGSTEVTLCREKRILRGASFNLGAARLQQIFLKKSPPTEESIQALRLFVQKTLYREFKKNRWPKVKRVVGSSGTIKTIVKIIQKRRGKKNKISTKMICRVNSKMKTYDLNKLKKIPGMDKDRADMILSGGIILEEVLKCLGAKYLTRTEFSLRDGILYEELRRGKGGDGVKKAWNY